MNMSHGVVSLWHTIFRLKFQSSRKGLAAERLTQRANRAKGHSADHRPSIGWMNQEGKGEGPNSPAEPPLPHGHSVVAGQNKRAVFDAEGHPIIDVSGE